MQIISFMQTILNMSLTGSIAILTVILVRLLLKKSPKIFSYLLWSIVLFRLLCPVSITSSLSLFRFAAKTGTEIVTAGSKIQTDEKQTVVPDISQMTDKSYEPGSWVLRQIPNKTSMETIYWLTAAGFWLMGMLFVCGYMAYHYWKAKKMLRGAVHVDDNIYEITWDVSPFVIGLFHPKICLPVGLGEEERAYILLHEKTHIKRGDFFVKMLAFAALCLHWFNPLVWLAFFLLEKDMELACDEAVMRYTKNDIRTQYAQSLVNLAAEKRMPGVPLTFAEGGLKERVKNVMCYKKPKIYAIVLSVFVIVLCAVSLGSNPKSIEGQESPANLSDSGRNMSDSIEGQESSGNLSDSGRNVSDTGLKTEAGGINVTDVKSQADSIAISYMASDASDTSAAEIEKYLIQWAEAFSNRDAQTILAKSSSEVTESLRKRELLNGSGEQASFGLSSPWMLLEKDYQILDYDENSAQIIYYAWTSEPHVTVWRETLVYHKENDSYQTDMESLQYLDYICTAEEFLNAYPFGISGTNMDYLTNGAGEALNSNAMLSSNNYYRGLFEADKAAVMLLNLLDNPDKVKVLAGPEAEDGSVPVEVTFLEDGSVFVITMVNMSESQDGIWVPQSYERYK